MESDTFVFSVGYIPVLIFRKPIRDGYKKNMLDMCGHPDDP